MGFRGEVPLLFEVRPAVPVTVRVTGADGKPTGGPGEVHRRLFVALDRGGKGHLTPDDAKQGALPLPEPFATLDADGDGRMTEVELRQGGDRTWDKLPDLCVSEMNGIGGQEVCVTTALGLCDFVSAVDTERVPEWNVWYHLLNCGFPLVVSGETDFPCISGGRVGQGRVCVRQGQADRVDFAACATDGDRGVRRRRPARHRHRWQDARWERPHRRADRHGKVAAKQEVPADDRPHDLAFDVPVERSSWVALRQFPQLHTNLVPVPVGGKPIRASRDSAKWCVRVIEQLWRVRAKAIAAAERPEAEATLRKVLEHYQRIAAESE